VSAAQPPLRFTLGPLHNPIRGFVHGTAALLALAVAARFVFLEELAPPLRAAFVGFAATQAGLFLASAAYHSVPWNPLWKRRMQRIDHSMIYLAIAGCATPLALLGPSPAVGGWIVAGVWAIAVLGVAQKAVLPQLHERASIPLQVAQAALAVPALIGFAARFPGAPSRLLILGVALYTAGAVIFLTERPRLWPRVFSFHELFHVLVVAGSGSYYLMVSRFVA
jgi:hemolysin III